MNKDAESPRALVVDDDAALAALLEHVFTAHGYAVTTAHSGREAMEALSRDNFDVLLVDIRMPDMGGLEVIERVQEVGVPLPVMVVSGYVGCLEMRRLSRLGVRHVFRKPFKVEALLDAVRRLTVEVADASWAKS